jgi:hypothetical protein
VLPINTTLGSLELGRAGVEERRTWNTWLNGLGSVTLGEGERRNLMTEEPSASLALDDPQPTGNRR